MYHTDETHLATKLVQQPIFNQSHFISVLKCSFYFIMLIKKKHKYSHSYCTSPSLQAHISWPQTVLLNCTVPIEASLSLCEYWAGIHMYILSPDLVLWLLILCQIFDQRVYWFHLTHIGYLQIIQVWSVKLIDCFQKQWWKVPKAIKGNYSLFHLIRVFMEKLFDVASIVQELCESRGGRPELSVLTSLLASVDVKIYWTMLRHWSQFVPNMSSDIRGH